MRILLIEDSITDIQAFKTSARAWSIGKAETIEVEECVTLESAFGRLSSPNDLDGIVLDLKLPHEANGEEVIKRIGELYLRIPVVVLSGTPSELDDDYQAMCLKCFIKGEQHENQILDLLWDCKRSGLMDLIGGKGLFEKHLKTVFDKCIVPRLDDWRGMLQTVDGGDTEAKTREALTRHILACLAFVLSNDTDKIQPEECYIPLTSDAEVYKYPIPGMIVSDANSTNWLVLNPACDLALRPIKKKREDGHVEEIVAPKTQHIFLVAIESVSSVLDRRNSGDKRKFYANNADLNVHWLPTVKSFVGGFANFRVVTAVPCEGFFDKYYLPETPMAIHPEVLKNIQSRFANYYARQGQPDIAYDRFI